MISVAVPPRSSEKYGDNGSVASGLAGTIVLDSDSLPKISGLDAPTVSVYMATFQNEYSVEEATNEDDINRRQIWSKSCRRACLGLLLLAGAISGVVYLFENMVPEHDHTETNISAANSNAVDPASSNSPTKNPTAIDRENNGSEGFITDDFFTGMDNENEQQQQQQPGRVPDGSPPSTVENAPEPDDWDQNESANVDQVTTTSPQEEHQASTNAPQQSATATPTYSFGTDANTDGQEQDWNCTRDPAAVQTKGGGWGGGGNGNGGGGGGGDNGGGGNGNGNGCTRQNNNGLRGGGNGGGGNGSNGNGRRCCRRTNKNDGGGGNRNRRSLWERFLGL